jgi:hypothetical protein
MRNLLLPAVVALAAALVPQSASAHDVYTGMHDPFTGNICCNGQDCYALESESVRRVDKGWEFKDRDGILRSVLSRQAQPSPDGRFHYCYWGQAVRCFMIPATM